VTTGLLERGWAVAMGQRFRIAAPPGIRVSYAALPAADAAGFAGDLAEMLRQRPSRARLSRAGRPLGQRADGDGAAGLVQRGQLGVVAEPARGLVHGGELGVGQRPASGCRPGQVPSGACADTRRTRMHTSGACAGSRVRYAACSGWSMDDTYCVEVLTQISAATRALQAVATRPARRPPGSLRHPGHRAGRPGRPGQGQGGGGGNLPPGQVLTPASGPARTWGPRRGRARPQSRPSAPRPGRRRSAG